MLRSPHPLPRFSLSAAEGRCSRQAAVSLQRLISGGWPDKNSSVSRSVAEVTSREVQQYSSSRLVTAAALPSADSEADMAATAADMAAVRERLQAVINANPKGEVSRLHPDTRALLQEKLFPARGCQPAGIRD